LTNETAFTCEKIDRASGLAGAAQGRRRYRKTDAQNITQARQIRNAELLRVEQARVLGFSPPGEDSFEAVAKRYLSHQKARVSRESYLRERSV
jgi:hypothetical protein